MSKRVTTGAGTIDWEESPEQAARAISAALVFLQFEAYALGMFDVSRLIGKARTKADEVVEFAASHVGEENERRANGTHSP